MFKVVSFLALSVFSAAQDRTVPAAPAHIVYTAQGRGVQIYRCTQQDATFVWTFQSPEATLVEPKSQKRLGTHGAGPTWTWADGSTIAGKVMETSPSPDPDSIPWLLLSASPVGASSGALTRVALVRRSDTHGGNAPATGCDAQHVSATLRVPYSATYTFYAAR
jgi:hypothetical protein